MSNKGYQAFGAILLLLLVGLLLYLTGLHWGIANNQSNYPSVIWGLLIMLFMVAVGLGLYGWYVLHIVRKYQIWAEGAAIENSLLEKHILELKAELTNTVKQLNQEIERRNHLAEQLRVQTTSDSLTGLLNRKTGMAWLVNQLHLAEKQQCSLTIWSININNLKQLRKRLGYDKTDKLVKEISRIISENIRKTDTIFRMADDEMIVVLPQCTIPEAMGVRDRVINSWQPNPIFAHCKWQDAICDGFAEYQPGSRMRVTDLVQQAGENAFHKDKYYPQIFSTDKRSLM